MLIDKRSLAVTKMVSTDETRQVLQTVHVLPDGGLEATNGHILGRISRPLTPTDEAPEEWKGASDDLKDKLLNASDLVDVIKKLPKRQYIPILACASISSTGAVSFDMGQDQRHATVRLLEDQSFPDTDAIFNDKPKEFVQVRVAAKYLRVLADMVDNKSGTILLTIPKEDQVLGAIHFQCSGDRPVDGVLMPMRV